MEKVCCFIGHREIKETDELKRELKCVVEDLIVNRGIDTFLFGSKSRFDSLCLETVTSLKEVYPFIKRIYVRAEYQHTDESYTAYLLKSYDETYYPEKLLGAGKSVYVERNFEMIDKAKICVFYYNPEIELIGRKSGTEIAYNYADKKEKTIINIIK